MLAAAAKSPQSCLTLCDPIDRSPPGAPARATIKEGGWYFFPVGGRDNHGVSVSPHPMHCIFSLESPFCFWKKKTYCMHVLGEVSGSPKKMI